MDVSNNPQLRAVAYLRSDIDKLLFDEMVQLPDGRRALRLMEMARSGLRAESERMIYAPTARQDDSSIEETPQTMKVYLRINFGNDRELYETVRGSSNRSDRLRSLASKGMLASELLRSPIHKKDEVTHPIEPVQPSKAMAMMTSMVAGLAEDL